MGANRSAAYWPGKLNGAGNPGQAGREPNQVRPNLANGPREGASIGGNVDTALAMMQGSAPAPPNVSNVRPRLGVWNGKSSARQSKAGGESRYLCSIRNCCDGFGSTDLREPGSKYGSELHLL